MAEEAQELSVTNSVQPITVLVDTAETTEVAGTSTPQGVTDQTITITTASE